MRRMMTMMMLEMVKRARDQVEGHGEMIFFRHYYVCVCVCVCFGGGFQYDELRLLGYEELV